MRYLVCLAFLAGQAFAAISHVQSTQCSGTDSPMACAFTSNIMAGNLIVVAIRTIESGAAISSVTDTGSNTYALAISSGTHYDQTEYIYYAKNAAGGANTVSVAYTGSWAIMVAIHEYGGIDQTAPLDKTSSAYGGSGAGDSGAQTTTQADELIFGAEASNVSLASKEGSGFTARTSSTYGGGHLTEDKIVSSIGSYSASFLDNGGVWCAAMATFKGASGTRRRQGGVIQ